ncbi:MAG TPA: CaiB/BaiF CoA-transferase family protein [Cyclobacteriaceae bacterium]|jgi:crotonobetainyl-CoA:carnitine CoA-transferase CaiB-like acyl-CoA transferase|nr:CaiB/BaiF CoA-transferase family protein [Cyclobacteriaceae bacterium]
MLNDLKVLELASVLAGPSVGQFFAELGAEVIKIENPKIGGDVTRGWKTPDELTDDRSAYFCSCNWGKKSVALDLTIKKDLEIVKKLATKCDIVIASYKPGDAEKLGVSYQQLRTNNPQLIYGQITGYGSDDDRVGYDAVIQAEAGFMALNGEHDGPPTKMPVALIDVLAAHQLKEGLLLALLRREKTKEGSFVEVSLIQTAVASLANQATNWLVGKKLPQRQGSAHPNIAPYGDSFVTQDSKRILLAVGSDKQFDELVKILGLESEDLGDRFVKNQERVAHRKELNKILSEKIMSINSKVFIEELHAKKIPAGFIQNLKDVFELPQVTETLLSGAGVQGVRNYIGKGAGGWKIETGLLPPPHLGEHTEEVVSGLDNKGI